MAERMDSRRDYLLEHMRRICLALPEARETVKWGNPTFEAGRKMFAVLDRYEGQWCIAFRVPGNEREHVLQRTGYRPAPYSAKHGWVVMDAAGRIRWKEVARLVEGSYREVALRRMLAALDG